MRCPSQVSAVLCGDAIFLPSQSDHFVAGQYSACPALRDLLIAGAAAFGDVAMCPRPWKESRCKVSLCSNVVCVLEFLLILSDLRQLSPEEKIRFQTARLDGLSYPEFYAKAEELCVHVCVR